MKELKFVVSTREQVGRLEEKLKEFSEEYDIESTGGLLASFSGPAWIGIDIYPEKDSVITRVLPRNPEGKTLLRAASPNNVYIQLKDIFYNIKYKP